MSKKPKPEKVHSTPAIKWSHQKKLIHWLAANRRLFVLAVVICCVIAGCSTLVIKTATFSYSLWPENLTPKTITSTNSSGIELGVKFDSRNSGYVTAIRFYKDTQNTGTHTGSLWGGNGTLLARVTFAHETKSGWQTAKLAQPINIAANVMYEVSYHAPDGHYSLTSNYFSNRQYINVPLTALPDNSECGANGVYAYGANPEFPNKDMGGANFWVDLIFSTKLVSAPSAPAPPTSISATQNGTTIIVGWNIGISANPITGYNVLRNGTLYAKVSGNTLNYVDYHVRAGLTYGYEIQTLDNTGKLSAASNTASVTYNATAPPTAKLLASTSSVTLGNSTTLSWSSTNAITCLLNSSASGILPVAISGSQTVSPTVTTTYSLVCHNNWGSVGSLPVIVRVPPTVTLTVTHNSITAGNSSTLSWSSTNASSCQAVLPADWTSSTAISGSQTVAPTITTTYTLSCSGSGGSTSSPPITIKVTPVAPTISSLQPLGNISGPWKLVFDSEFNGSSLNSSQWSTGTDSASGITQGYDKAIEQECYDPAQVSVGNGELNLAAIAQTCPPAGGTLPYTSGSITTYDHFSYTYGYAEARIWLPGTTSIADWPAFWELGKLYNVSKGEIDILEGTAGQACATFHNASSNPSFCSAETFTGGWHTFAAEWEPGNINFYYDGYKVLTVTSGVTSYPMYLVLDLAFATKITSPNTAPATMLVDYVRVWQH